MYRIYFAARQSVMKEKMVRPGFEPGTFCVLDRCDNQLRHRTDSDKGGYGYHDR